MTNEEMDRLSDALRNDINSAVTQWIAANMNDQKSGGLLSVVAGHACLELGCMMIAHSFEVPAAKAEEVFNSCVHQLGELAKKYKKP